MTDEVTPAPSEDTPTEVQEPAPSTEDTAPAPVVDYEQRYNNLRPEFDRTKQQIKEYEDYIASLQNQEPDEYEDEDDDSYLYEDPVARQRLEQIEARLAEKEQAETLQAQQDQERSYIEENITTLESRLGEEFSDDEFDWLGHRAFALRDEDGNPDVERAYEQFSNLIEGRKQKWVKTKKSPKVRSGPSAAEIPDLDTSEARAEHINRRLAELDAD